MNAISEAESILHHAMNAIDNPAISALTCTPDYLGGSLEPTEKSLNDLEEAYNNYISDTTKGKGLIRAAIHGAHLLALYLIYAKSTSNTSTDIGLADSKSFFIIFYNYVDDNSKSYFIIIKRH